MCDDAIVAYRRPPAIDAELELEALGDRFSENFLLSCQRLVIGKSGGVDHWTLQPFEIHRGVPVYKYQDGARFALFAVEELGEGERRISLIMAARTGRASIIDGAQWDGLDFSLLRKSMLRSRLEDYFE